MLQEPGAHDTHSSLGSVSSHAVQDSGAFTVNLPHLWFLAFLSGLNEGNADKKQINTHIFIREADAQSVRGNRNTPHMEGEILRTFMFVH